MCNWDECSAAWGYQRLLKILMDEAVDKKAAVEQHEGFVGDVFHFDEFFLRQRMLGIGTEAGFAFKQLAVVQVGRKGIVVVGDGKIKLFVFNHAQRVDAARFNYFQFDFGGAAF